VSPDFKEHRAMAVYRIEHLHDFKKAGKTDLIGLRAVPGSHPVYVEKGLLEILVVAIVDGHFIHLSGPTGTAKTSLLEAFRSVPENFKQMCVALGLPVKPLQVFAIPMVGFESPGELYARRALADGSTFDEESNLVQALKAADETRKSHYNVIWTREMGRVHSASVQGGLLDLMSQGNILLGAREQLSGAGIAWIADSNYVAEQDSTYTLVPLDEALKRRFSVNITLRYLSEEQEVEVVRHLVAENPLLRGIEDALIGQVVRLGQHIRQERVQGNLASLAPPTIYGYLTFLRMAKVLSHLPLYDLALTTLLGNASGEDEKLLPAVFGRAFGLRVVDDTEPADMGGIGL
jgi:hypothetical protein